MDNVDNSILGEALATAEHYDVPKGGSKTASIDSGLMDVIEGFCWHSSLGISGFNTQDGNERFVTRMANTKEARSMFVKAGENLLIHKATKCLWKLSEDGKSIVPVFASDVLSEEEALEACR